MIHPKISFIIPAYNRAKTIKVCIESLLSLEDKDFELIIVDDGSTDDTAKICKEIGDKDSRIIYIYQENQGVSAARNKGISKAFGEWITFVDSDCAILPNHFSVLSNAESKNADMLMTGFCNGIFYDDKLKTNNSISKGEFIISKDATAFLFGEYNPMKNSFYVIWNKFFRRNIIETNNIRFNQTMSLGEDQVFVCDYLHYAKKLVYDSTPTYINVLWDGLIHLGSKLRTPDDFLHNQRLNYQALYKLYECHNEDKVLHYAVNYGIDRPITRIIGRYTQWENLHRLPKGELRKFTETEIVPFFRTIDTSRFGADNTFVRFIHTLLMKGHIQAAINSYFIYNLLTSACISMRVRAKALYTTLKNHEMKHLAVKSSCCGCNACVQRCPKHCIIMHEDKEGFLYPYIDERNCIDCGACEQVCPALNQNENSKPLQVVAVKNRTESQRLNSSSGGVFILLAEKIIKNGGVVFGAHFNKDWNVEHCYAEKLEDLEPLMRSKYVQSNIRNAYKEAEVFLKQKRKVLFVGTPCQIVGLRKFLRKSYENLITVDFVCHGVPSPGVWKSYLEDVARNATQSTTVGKNTVLLSPLKSMPVITGINFREKQPSGYSWKKYGFIVQGKSPLNGDQNSVILSNSFSENPYMKAFLGNLILRPSCYNCTAKDGRSESDLTIGDFWGIEHFHPEFDDDKGTSVIFVHTENGEKTLKGLGIDVLNTSFDVAVKYNHSYHKSVDIPSGRPKFWKMFHKGETVAKCFDYATKVSMPLRIKAKIGVFIYKIFKGL